MAGTLGPYLPSATVSILLRARSRFLPFVALARTCSPGRICPSRSTHLRDSTVHVDVAHVDEFPFNSIKKRGNHESGKLPYVKSAGLLVSAIVASIPAAIAESGPFK